MEETGARISVPPLSLQKDEIVVSGEKEGVHKAVETINNIYEDKVRLKYSEIDQDDMKWFLARFFFFEKRKSYCDHSVGVVVGVPTQVKVCVIVTLWLCYWT